MRGMSQLVGVGVLGLAVSGLTGCNMVPRRVLSQSQQRAAQLYKQNQSLAMERDSLMAQAGENQTLKQQLADERGRADTLQARLDNSQAEGQKLRDQFTGMQQTSPLPADATEALRKMIEKYPEFDFDPATGVSKFDTDVLFESGSAQLKPGAEASLRQFAQIMNSGVAQELSVLVVGHTDDQRVGKPGTKAKHPDNWYLSAHRSIAVREALQKYGLKDARMGVAGYGPYQPVKPNTNDQNRAANRRVEIFVLAPNAAMAGWDGEATFKE